MPFALAINTTSASSDSDETIDIKLEIKTKKAGKKSTSSTRQNLNQTIPTSSSTRQNLNQTISTSSTRQNLNKVDAQVLEDLPFWGQATAKLITDNRPFACWSEVSKVKGLKKGRVDSLKAAGFVLKDSDVSESEGRDCDSEERQPRTRVTGNSTAAV